MESLRIFRHVAIPEKTIAPLSGLASVDLALGDLDGARAHAADVLAYLNAGGPLAGGNRPFWAHLTCCQVLAAAGDPRAAEMLERGHAQLMEWAGRISDEAMRRSFLENVAENRELVRLWEEAHAGGDAADGAALPSGVGGRG